MAKIRTTASAFRQKAETCIGRIARPMRRVATAAAAATAAE